jgi:hypothetical protein
VDRQGKRKRGKNKSNKLNAYDRNSDDCVPFALVVHLFHSLVLSLSLSLSKRIDTYNSIGSSLFNIGAHLSKFLPVSIAFRTINKGLKINIF